MNKPLYGPRINYADPQSRQQAFAYQLLQQGASTRPVHTPLEGLARALQAGVGGYFSNQADEEQKAKEAEKARVMAEALRAGQGAPAAPPPTLAAGEAAATRGTGVASQPTPGDPNKMAQILMSNPQLAPMGLQLGIGQMQFNQQQQAAQKATEAAQNFQKEMTRINQAFQTGQLTQQQAHAAAMQAQAQAHAAGMQTSAQNFTAGQNAAQQTFTAGQNQLNRENAVSVAAARLENQPPTEGQANAATYADRMANSHEIIKNLEAVGTDMTQAALARLPYGNLAMSDDRQKFEQAKRDFVNATLRRESGAVISDAEFENANKQYFPQVGDSQAVIEQKRKNRETTLAGIARAAGPRYTPPSLPPAAPPGAPPPGPGGTPPLPAGFQPLP